MTFLEVVSMVVTWWIVAFLVQWVRYMYAPSSVTRGWIGWALFTINTCLSVYCCEFMLFNHSYHYSLWWASKGSTDIIYAIKTLHLGLYHYNWAISDPTNWCLITNQSLFLWLLFSGWHIFMKILVVFGKLVKDLYIPFMRFKKKLHL